MSENVLRLKSCLCLLKLLLLKNLNNCKWLIKIGEFKYKTNQEEHLGQG